MDFTNLRQTFETMGDFTLFHLIALIITIWLFVLALDVVVRITKKPLAPFFRVLRFGNSIKRHISFILLILPVLLYYSTEILKFIK